MSLRPLALFATLLSWATLAGTGHAQPGEHDYRRPGDYGYFVLGALTGLLVHEGSHLTLDAVLRTHPTIEPVRLGRIPFFAIQPNRVRSDRQLYAIAMMGFVAEAITNDIVLTRRPNLRANHAPFLEGMLGFNVGLDVGYAITGIANVGPPQSDVNSMARAARIPRWAVGLMLLVPAAFDVVRYVEPDAKWAPWVARGARLVLFGTVFAFPRRRYADQAPTWHPIAAPLDVPSDEDSADPLPPETPETPDESQREPVPTTTTTTTTTTTSE